MVGVVVLVETLEAVVAVVVNKYVLQEAVMVVEVVEVVVVVVALVVVVVVLVVLVVCKEVEGVVDGVEMVVKVEEGVQDKNNLAVQELVQDNLVVPVD